MPITTPRYAPSILTPSSTSHSPTQLPPQTIHLLTQLVKKYLPPSTSEQYSIIFSPILYPQGKNHFFTLKPYYWDTDQAGQPWERRDGQRNPYCDLPQAQNQLQELSKAIHILSLGHVHLPKLRKECLKRAEELMEVFFVHEETRMIPQVLYSQCKPGEDPLKGDGCFVIAIRYLILITQSLPNLPLSADLNGKMRAWFQAQVEWMVDSEQGMQARGYGNNISIWYWAILHTHQTYLSPSHATSHPAFQTLQTLFTTYPTPQKLCARELERTRARHYVLFMLEPLFLIASLVLQAVDSAGGGGDGLSGKDCLSHHGDSDEYAREGDTIKPTVLATDEDKDEGGRFIPLQKGRIHETLTPNLRLLITYAKTIPPSEMEKEVENELRYRARMSWFEKILDGWEPSCCQNEGRGLGGGGGLWGGDVKAGTEVRDDKDELGRSGSDKVAPQGRELDGSGWEKGWTSYPQMGAFMISPWKVDNPSLGVWGRVSSGGRYHLERILVYLNSCG